MIPSFVRFFDVHSRGILMSKVHFHLTAAPLRISVINKCGAKCGHPLCFPLSLPLLPLANFCNALSAVQQSVTLGLKSGIDAATAHRSFNDNGESNGETVTALLHRTKPGTQGGAKARQTLKHRLASLARINLQSYQCAENSQNRSAAHLEDMNQM